MSNLTVKGNASGTGTVILEAPNTNTNRTITLPDATATLASTAYVDTSVATAARMVTGTAVASTSGTAIDFTGIPSWARRVTVMFDGVSTNGSSPMLVQLGDSGGIETTGYLSMVGARDAAGGVLGALTSTAGFATQYIGAATSAFNGTLQLSNMTSNTWVGSGVGNNNTATAYVYFYSGSKTLSATLDRVRITTANGTDTFDAGTINIMWEG